MQRLPTKSIRNDVVIFLNPVFDVARTFLFLSELLSVAADDVQRICKEKLASTRYEASRDILT